VKSGGENELAVETSTRHRIFSAIMAHSGITATELASLLGITPAAVRRHIELLEADGYIAVRTPRPHSVTSRGRPAKAFMITDAGRDQFHQAYGQLAVEAIGQLLAAAGPDGLDALAAAHFAPIEAAFGAAMAEHDAASPSDALVQALDAGGYAAEASPLAGGLQLCQHHCPVADVARLYPKLCVIETALIAGLLESHVQRLATIAHGDGVCTINIPLREGRA